MDLGFGLGSGASDASGPKGLSREVKLALNSFLRSCGIFHLALGALGAQ